MIPSSRRRRASAAPNVLLVVAVVGLAVAQGLDFAITASGVLFLKIALPLPVIGSWGIAIGCALVLQCCSVASELVLASAGFALRSALSRTAIAVAAVLLIGSQTIAAFFHFTQLTNWMDGSNLIRTLAFQASTIDQQVLTADRRIRVQYRTAIADEWQLAQQSKKGLDASGIARCGPRCKGAMHRARQIETRFAALTTPIASLNVETGSAAADFAALKQMLDGLRAKVPAYKQLCTFMGWTYSDPVAAIVADPTYQRLKAAMVGAQMADRRMLVLQQTGRSLSALRHGWAGVREWVQAAFVLILPPAELGLILYLRLVFAARRAAAIEALKREQEEVDELLRRESRLATSRVFADVMAQQRAEDGVPAE